MNKKLVVIVFLALTNLLSFAMQQTHRVLTRKERMQSAVAPEIQQLIDGNKQFRKKNFGKKHSLFNELQHGQWPKIMIVSCSDSRVDPAIIFNGTPGQFFGVRNIANLVPPYETNDNYPGTSSALEYGITVLEVKHAIVLGHVRCGGIEALLKQNPSVKSNPESFIAKWLQLGQPVYERVMAEYADKTFQEQITFCERYSLINSLKNLLTFPWIKERVDSGKLSLHAWYFDLATGMVHRYDLLNDQWVSE